MKKVKIILMALCMALTMSMGVSAEELSTFTELYKEDFTYGSENIADALKATTVYVSTTVKANITYQPVMVKTDELIQHIVKLKEANPDVDLQTVYDYMLTKTTDYLYYEGTVPEESTAGIRGSGVVISEDGYIATNRHVVKKSEEEWKERHLNNIGAIIENNCDEIVNSIESIFGSGAVGEDMYNEIYEILVDAYLSKLTISDSKISYTVCYPGADGEATADSSRMLEATLVEVGGDNRIEDAAIIKVDAKNLVALELAAAYPNTGSEIWACGYPAAADFTDSSYLTATLTTGKVSGVKQADGSSFKFIQSEAAISGGNSGGPSSNNKCKVLGLNTFGMTADPGANYNYIVPYETINTLASKISIGQGDLSKTFMTGIQAMQENNGLTAVECFKAVKALNPKVPYINELITRAEGLPQNSASGSRSMDIPKPAIYAGIAVVTAAVIAVVIILIVKSRKPKYSYVEYNNLQSESLEGEIMGSSTSMLGSSGDLLTETTDNNSFGGGGDSLL